ncbi:hypothetical protein [Bradyrhizobium sp. CCBAU 11386]|uniref:hypothetical protein n=1 Tax=Bradyrhizobium sp. CCBAU 11386 TaxID=1630837 RepID=UPI002302AC49|nr:hypothetical protein [Bradyrhizobium sp. CCBAU 11386]
MAQVNPENSTPMPAVSTRRRFLSHAASVAVSGAVLSLATNPPAAAVGAPAGALASPDVDPIFALISRHRAEERAYEAALMARDELEEIVPEEFRRPGRVQWGMKDGVNPYYLHSHKQIDDCLVAGSRHSPKIKAQLHADLDRDRFEIWAKREEIGLPYAEERVAQLCDSCQDLEWALANTMPTSIAGVAALLRYANEVEDQGEEWPDTDTIGPDGWHYQLRQTAARALQTVLATDQPART